MMKAKQTIYFDTSVPSSFYDTEAPEQTAMTRLFWEEYLKHYAPYISEATLQEIKGTKDLAKQEEVLKLVNTFDLLKIDQATEDLAGAYLESGVIPQSYPIDALHVASATINKIELLVTWNIRHMANPNRRKKLTEYNAQQNLHIPQLTTPQELIQSYENDNNN